MIKNFYASTNGGLIYALDTTTSLTSNITFTNSAQIDSINTTSNGGSFYLNNPNLNLYMNTVISLTNSYVSSGKGGVFYINDANNVQIAGSSFTSFSSSLSGSFMYSVSTNLKLNLTGNDFKCKNSAWTSLQSDLSVP